MAKRKSDHRAKPPRAASAALPPEHPRLDDLIQLVSLTARPVPLSSFLDRAPQLVARIFAAPVASLYLLDSDGETIVMRGNTGFGKTALGQVRMRVGEGLTGLAIADGRPFSVAHAPAHDLFLGFPELQEEKYPVFAVAPVMGEQAPIGGLVVQRATEPFSPEEMALLMALTACILSALRRDEHLDLLHQRPTRRSAPQAGARRALLAGRPGEPGLALGKLALIPRPSGRGARVGQTDGAERLCAAFDTARRAVRTLQRQWSGRVSGPGRALLETHAHLLLDARLRERALELVAAGSPVNRALGQVAREAARASVLAGDPFLQARVRELETLCDALAVLAAQQPGFRLPSQPIIIADTLSLYDLLVASLSRPAGIVLTERGTDERSRAILELFDLPSLIEVKGLWRWAAEGDIALLDATHGYLHINPSRLDVVEFKARQREAARV